MIKFKDVTSICKAEKRLVLAEDDGVQCIGDGAALYYMYNLPKLEIGDIFTLMDVDAEQQKKWYTREGCMVEITGGFGGGKIPMQKAPLILFWNGMSLCPFYNEDHEMVTFINDRYTYPIRTETDIYYDLAINPNGDMLMEVRNGALSIAKIAPVRIKDSGVLVGQLKRLTEMIGK